MPENFSDWWWEDMPPRAHKAAEIMGYTHQKWDGESSGVKYDDTPFAKLTVAEKQAATMLGMAPLGGTKLDVWWEELDAESQKQAQVLGWTQHKWDDDWEIHHLECEEWYWKDMTAEQRNAAKHFGYNRSTWDETEYDEDWEFADTAAEVSTSTPAQNAPSPDDVDEEAPSRPTPVVAAAMASAVPAAASEPDEEADEADDSSGKKKKNKTKVRFAETDYWGGEGGAPWDHRNNRTISSITVSSGKVVDGLTVVYNGGNEKKQGGEGKNNETMNLRKGEYVNKITVRAGKFIQCLTFTTNKGQVLGPCGGKGIFMVDKEGVEDEVQAPPGMMLCGIKGREGKFMDAIGFRWSSVQM